MTHTLTRPETTRQTRRQELAALLDVDVELLTDSALLVDDLHLDSMAMMSLRVWLEGQGVRFAADSTLLRSVSDVLSMVERLPRGVAMSVHIDPEGDGVLPGSHGLSGSLGLTSTLGLARPFPPSPSSDLVPVLENHALRLTPVDPNDHGFLYLLAVAPETGYRWRYRGSPPSVDRFNSDIWAQVLVQYVVRQAHNGERIGHVVAYAAELGQGHCYLGAVFTPEHTGNGYAAQAVNMFVRYLFHTFPLRKVYMDVPGFNWPQLSSGANELFIVEGILRDHDYYAGRYWDKYLCAIYPPEGRAAGHS